MKEEIGESQARNIDPRDCARMSNLRETNYGDVANRFSINSENIMPLCLRLRGEEEDLGRSQVEIYNLGPFH